MAKIIDMHELIWQGARSKRYPTDPEEVRQTVHEKRIQREIDERIRRQGLNISDDEEQSPASEKSA